MERDVEASPLKSMYDEFKRCAQSGEDCTEILQQIIDYSYENVISEAELKRHLA